MNKLLLVIRREIVYNIKRPAFLFAMVLPPIIMVGTLLLGVLTSTGVNDPSEYGKIGFVDNSTEQVLEREVPLEDEDVPPDTFVRYETRDDAVLALENGDITAFFVLPTSYMISGQVGLYSESSVPSVIQGNISNFIFTNLSDGVELSIPLPYVLNPTDELTYVALDTYHAKTLVVGWHQYHVGCRIEIRQYGLLACAHKAYSPLQL